MRRKKKCCNCCCAERTADLYPTGLGPLTLEWPSKDIRIFMRTQIERNRSADTITMRWTNGEIKATPQQWLDWIA